MESESGVVVLGRKLYTLCQEQGVEFEWYRETETDSYFYKLSKGDKRIGVSIPVLDLLLQPVDCVLEPLRQAVLKLMEVEEDEYPKYDNQDTQI